MKTISVVTDDNEIVSPEVLERIADVVDYNHDLHGYKKNFINSNTPIDTKIELRGTVKTPSIKDQTKLLLENSYNLKLNIIAGKVYKQFDDFEVEKVLKENGIGDGLGITEENLNEITSINTWFVNNNVIKSFNEFTLTKVTSIWQRDGFLNCTNLEEIEVPNTLKELSSLYNRGGLAGTNLTKFDFKLINLVEAPFGSTGPKIKEIILRVPLRVCGSGGWDAPNVEKIYIESIENFLKNSYQTNPANSCVTRGGKASLYLLSDKSNPLTSITIPSTVTTINPYALYNLKTIKTISYDGTIIEWKSLSKGTNWHYNVGGNTPVTLVQCLDGLIDIDATE